MTTPLDEDHGDAVSDALEERFAKALYAAYAAARLFDREFERRAPMSVLDPFLAHTFAVLRSSVDEASEAWDDFYASVEANGEGS